LTKNEEFKEKLKKFRKSVEESLEELEEAKGNIQKKMEK